MTLNSRSKPRLKRDRGKVRDPKLFFIATEGQETERQYLDFFEDSRIKIISIPSQKGKSSPNHVLENMNNFVSTRGLSNHPNCYEFSDIDEFWLLLDTDHWVKPNHIQNFQRVIQQADQKGYQLGISNACFEVWLLLHLTDLLPEDLNKDSAYYEIRLRQILGAYNKSKIKKEDFYALIPEAIERARQINNTPSHRWPNNTGSYIYKLVEKFL